MTVRTSPTTAAGQLLGYSIQFPRALCRLLQTGPEGAVGVEVLGDVDAYAGSGMVISEEDKSSVVCNPLTDRSTDLWKTFHNWVKAVVALRLDIGNTRFILYCNKKGKSALVNRFSEARTPVEVAEALHAAEVKLGDTDHKHDIWRYYDYVMNRERKVMERIIPSFALVIGSDTAHKELEAELERMLFTGKSKVLLMDELGGWFQRLVMERISRGVPAIVTFQELRARFSAKFDQLRARELVDFAASRVSAQDAQSRLSTRPVFVQQLDLIDVDDETKLEAVLDFLCAECNRAAWIEDEFLDEETAADLENKLKRYWGSRKRYIELAFNTKEAKEQGQLLFSECKMRQESIRDVSPPASTISGTYHALSDRKDLGWHPEWKAKLNGAVKLDE
ncbi:MAG: hypothetical protein EOM62_11095 [Bacteroidia bacterium]|nr:hypothetical protein [Bacteroidia bacterium]